VSATAFRAALLASLFTLIFRIKLLVSLLLPIVYLVDGFQDNGYNTYPSFQDIKANLVVYIFALNIDTELGYDLIKEFVFVFVRNKPGLAC
jgi:hypothetical protein